MDAVLVINADLGPLHNVGVKHAIRMLCRRVATKPNPTGSSASGQSLES